MVIKADGKGSYATVNGLNMYYEVHGRGRPLVLLHGSLSAIGTSFGQLLPALAQKRQVIAPEMQAHGRTADIDRPLTVQQMAEDTAELLRQLQIEQADFFGYSLGSAIALQLALDHPNLARKLVLASVSYDTSGLYPGLIEGIKSIKPEDMAGSPFYEEYKQTAPRPEDWPRLVAKIQEFDSDLPSWTPEEIRSLKAPVLLVFGDSDIVRLEHAVEMFQLLGGGVAGDVAGLPASRLAVLPGTTHITVVHRAAWLAAMIEEFLDAPMPQEKQNV